MVLISLALQEDNSILHQYVFPLLIFEQTLLWKRLSLQMLALLQSQVVYDETRPSHSHFPVLEKCQEITLGNLQKFKEIKKKKKKKKKYFAVSSTSDIQPHAANLCVSLFSLFWCCQSDSSQLLPWFF